LTAAAPAEDGKPTAEGILANLGADQALADHYRDNSRAVTPAAWESPAPLGARRALPTFPVDALPSWVADMVAAVAEFTQTPPDLPAVVALAALSAAAGGRAVVEVRGTWREPVNLYAVVAMPPGSRKSPVFAAITAPLLDAERHLVEATRPRVVEADLARKVAQRAAERAAATAANTQTPEGRASALADASDAAVQADSITVPALPRLVADDVTSETAASLLAEQGGRLAVLSAEGGIFATLAGRYSNGVPSLEVFLKGHAGDMLRVDRKSRPAEHIDHPALTLGVAIQPELLRDIARMPGFRGRGLLARILYSLPPNTVGNRRPRDARPIPPPVADSYTTNLHALVTTLADWTDPAVLPLTPDAAEAVLTLEEHTEPRLHPDTGDLGHIADWAAKWVGAVVRIAGLLHLATHLRDGWGRPIELTTIDQAARIGRYHLDHALAAFDDMGADPVLNDARHILDWITRTRPEAFTRRDLFTGISRGRFRKVADLDPPLDLLTQHAWIRPVPQPETNRPGRPPSPAYDVHPALLDPAAETAETAETWPGP
jgi:hypothetical protein